MAQQNSDLKFLNSQLVSQYPSITFNPVKQLILASYIAALTPA